MKTSMAMLGVMLALLQSLSVPAAETVTTPDLSKPTLYLVGYPHLDTQWNWEYPTTIGAYIPQTMQQNFALFEKYPHYILNFSGANRYRMMQEYYPADFARVKNYVAKGRWFPCGSSWEECDVLVPAPESMIRQVLYGNQFFRRELGKESAEFMIPDCFGFTAALPSVLAHCGLRGFSTQKLGWGSAVGFPFSIGTWVGPDGKSVIMAANCGNYRTRINSDLSHPGQGDGKDEIVNINAEELDWLKRINATGAKSGVFADYIYYGEGDMGGAPTEGSVQWMEKSIAGDGPLKVISATAEQMFKDISDAQKAKLPTYQGDLLLTEHSAGTLTSQAYMKRWNRQNERLADAAERAAVAARLFAIAPYPERQLNAGWRLLLGTQFHDILPGTSSPRAYEYSMNDEILALNQFAGVLESSVATLAANLDTQTQGTPVVIFNPLSIERTDLVECEWPAGKPVAVFGTDGQEVLSQQAGGKLIFQAQVPSVGFAVYDLRPVKAKLANPGLKISENGLENERYRVTLNADGDVASIVDKTAKKELLAAPARLAFQFEHPWAWPAWNMDWKDRQKPPYAHVQGPAKIRIVENGPARVALEVRREAQDSIFVQTIRLAAGSERVEFATVIDWQTKASSLKATFPLAVSNPNATYNLGLGTIERGNNNPKKYEVPHQQWFDLTDQDGSYGVTILDDCKYGSDKPNDNTLRLTLLYTPLAQGNADGLNLYYQNTQDWGRHELTYAIAGHPGDWRQGNAQWQAARLNNPLRPFVTASHPGPQGKRLSLVKTNTSQIAITAIKKAETGDGIVIRLMELTGKPVAQVAVEGLSPIAITEVNGQEQSMGPAIHDKFAMAFAPYQMRSYLLRFANAAEPAGAGTPLALPCDTDLVSSDANMNDGEGNTLPAEQWPASLDDAGIAFKLGPAADGAKNALSCKGQTLALPAGKFNRLHLLAASIKGDQKAIFKVGNQAVELGIQDWSGFLGHWDARHWQGGGNLESITPAYIKRDPVAWFATHRHQPDGKNQSYAYAYLFHYTIDLPAGATSVTLPDNADLRIFAATAAQDPVAGTRAAAPLYDDFTNRAPIELRGSGKPIADGLKPVGQVTIDRQPEFAKLSMGAPAVNDYADAHAGNQVTVKSVGQPPHPGSFDKPAGDVWSGGAAGGETLLPRLNDGETARNGDDTARNVWWNGEGRFVMDLGKPIALQAVKTYSWHAPNGGNRAPQRFTLWGASDPMPSPAFANGGRSGWTYLARVDSSKLGNGGCHGSSVAGANGAPLGTFRYLLWIAEDVGEGTFFTELDAVEAKPAPNPAPGGDPRGG